MRNHRPSPREGTAYHEAGQAVVGHLLGWHVSSMSIEVGTSYRGYTAFMEPRPTRGHLFPVGVVDFDPRIGPELKEEELPDVLARDLAGVAAERALCRRRGVSALPVRLGRDTRLARASVQRYPRERRQDLLAAAAQRAADLLAVPVHWQAVDVLAQTLLTAESLSGDQVWHLLSETLATAR